MDKKWKVYVHISPNNKYYVGITSQKRNRRWRDGKGYTHNDYFNNAIEKYGWDNFQHHIVASNLTLDEANNFEEILIDKLQSNNRRYGYNLTLGGDGVKGVACSEERKLYLSKSMSGKSNPMYGISLDGMKGKDNPMYGKPATNRRKVLCITTNEIFDSLTEAASIYKTHRSDISKVCNGKRNYAGTLMGDKLTWRYV